MIFGKSALKQFTPVTDANAYTGGDCVGSIMSLPLGYLGAMVLKNLVVTDSANQKAPLTIVFFRSQPAGTFTNNAAFPLSNSDLALVCGKVNIAEDDYETIDSKAIAVKDISSVLQFDQPSPSSDSGVGVGPTTLYFGILTTGTPTYAVGSLRVSIGILPDE